MTDQKFLRLLAREYPTVPKIQGELIRLRGLGDMPKGTEYFFSDIHGESEAFVHLLRSASGHIRYKIRQIFDGVLDEDEQNQLANLIYDPERVLSLLRADGAADEAWLRTTLTSLVNLCSIISAKYRRGAIEDKMPPEFASILRELLFTDRSDPFRADLNTKIIDRIAASDIAAPFIAGLCVMIQRVSVNQLHIIGDIFDRGNGPHTIMEELMRFGDVDIQWGNHDVEWMGAACGNQVAMCSVLRVGINYDNFDALEHGYALNLRALSSFASRVYADDPCDRFRPKSLEANVYDRVDPDLGARMHKAIAMIMFKLESQLLDRHPEWQMEHRNVLRKTDFRRMVYMEDGAEYPLLDTHFPTIDPDDPARLTPEEEALMVVIDGSFRSSEPLRRHVGFLYSHGAAYTAVNGNLLFHGCVPLDESGEFDGPTFDGRKLVGKELFDYVDEKMRDAWFGTDDAAAHADAVDLAWYLWCGPLSPMFGKNKMSTFENYFVADKAVRKEHYNAYFTLAHQGEVCERILAEFGLPTDTGHIVNGHVPVKVKEGELPVKGDGKLYVIDGGISKAYHSKTGIAGYTLIFDSNRLALAQHRPYQQISDALGSYTPEIVVAEDMPHRVMVADTDLGVELREKVADLEELLEAYRAGTIKEAVG